MVIWGALLIFVVAISAYFTAVVLPRIFLRLRYTITDSKDRCIKRIYEVNGQSLIFEPEEKWRKYVKQYILAERHGKKEFICKVDKDLNYIVLDVAVFNCQNKLCDVIRIKDFVGESGMTGVVTLPEETSYVSVNVVRVENDLFEDKLSGTLAKGRMFKFVLVNAMLIVVESIWIKICMANLFGGIFRESFVMNLESLITTLLMAGALIIINTIVAAIALKIRAGKYKVKVRKNA